MQAAIIAIGDEILIGRTQDSNSHYLARMLHLAGIPVGHMQVIADEKPLIRKALARALETAHLVIFTGGLGPTSDDITKLALAGFFGQEALTVHQPTLERMRAWYASRGRELNPRSARMAEVPANCQPLDNPVGAAPGLLWEQEGRHVVALPGVPHEMRAIFEQQVLPVIETEMGAFVVQQEIFRLVGVPESKLSELLSGVEQSLPPEIKIAYNPNLGLLDLRVVLQCASEDEGRLRPPFEQALQEIRSIVRPYHYGDANTTLEEAVGQLLKAHGASLATAESCTGGHIAGRIVRIPGSSEYLQGGVIAYSNQVKMQQLGVRRQSLEEHGAVSEQVACEMARGVREALGTTLGVATTGVAGPGGGSDEKPVGLVYIGLATPEGVEARPFQFEKNRWRNIQRSVTTALHLVWKYLRQQPSAA